MNKIRFIIRTLSVIITTPPAPLNHGLGIEDPWMRYYIANSS